MVTTVEDKMTGLLSKSSPYTKLAQTGAKKQAASRGMLNSSIAAGAGEEAAIRSALPIATADANAENQFGLQKMVGDQSLSNISAQGTQTRQTQTLVGAQQQELQELRGQQQKGLLTQEGEQKLTQLGVQNDAAIELQRLQGQQQEGLLTQEGQQRLDQLSQQNEFSMHIQTMQNDFNASLQQMQLTSDEVKAIGSSTTLLGQTLSERVAVIQADSNLSGDAKTEIVQQLTDMYTAQLDSIASIYGVPISWE